ncbi:metallophosphoesterase family protein [Sulfitobacter porphyrae]|uniref:Metallophosphoesterase family protein n=1 Tax=Sulfitobacter porphyrae TaxID=1246864 RepID=A0ABW2B2U7_9RHOB
MGNKRHQNLGERNGALLLFGGPYSNLNATQALLGAARERGIAAAQMICTGDVVAYCAAPFETIELIRAAEIEVVAGNCEQQLAAGAADCGCGFEAGTTCDLLAAGWYAFATDRVAPAQRGWMAALPDIITFHHQGARYGVIHGGVTDVARFVWPTSPDEVLAEEWRAAEAAVGPLDHIISGHCGLPFIRDTPRGRWINPGVIGMPPHDGAQMTRYGVLDGGEVTLHRLRYDAGGEAARMQAAGLTQGYDRALLTGYWPSEDILPSALRVPSFASG